MSIKIKSDRDLYDFLENKDKNIIIKFSASWCFPCKKIQPFFDNLAYHKKDKFMCATVDIDNCKSASGKFSIITLPTFILFVKGKPYKTVKGANSVALKGLFS